MILFCLAVIVLLLAIVVNFFQPSNSSKVLIMSILAILMIMINFINEIDIVVFPPQIIVKKDSPLQKMNKKQVYRLNFNKQFQTTDMKHLQHEMLSAIQEIELFAKNESLIPTQKLTPAIQQSLQQSLWLLQSFPPQSHAKPLIKQQILLLQQLKNKLLQNEDGILHIPNIEKTRFQVLMQFYIKEMNEKASSYGLKFEKVVFVPIYESTLESTSKREYKLSDGLSQKDHHYVVVFDRPSQKLLQFLFTSYTSNTPSYLTIIFIDLQESINIFPISTWIQHIEFNPSNNYLQPITDYLYENIPKSDDDKQSVPLKEKMQREIQVCQKYVEMDFALFIRIMAFNNAKSLAQLCYEQTLQTIPQTIDCLRRLIPAPEDEIPHYKAKRCWQGYHQPTNLIRKNHNIKLRKQHFWSNKLSPANFGLETVIPQQRAEL